MPAKAPSGCDRRRLRGITQRPELRDWTVDTVEYAQDAAYTAEGQQFILLVFPTASASLSPRRIGHVAALDSRRIDLLRNMSARCTQRDAPLVSYTQFRIFK